MLVSNSNFVLTEIPKFNPFSLDFRNKNGWWGQEKRKCIEGYWSCGKWMPGVCYFYVNFWKIKLTIPGSKQEIIARPFLRDLEWEKAYLFTEAKGFSGFANDDEYSCHRLLELSAEDLEDELVGLPAIIKMSLYNSRGELKKYKPAREYLRMNHGTDKGKALYLNEARNIVDIEARGGGKSYFASAVIYHNFVFDGAVDYDEYLERKSSGDFLTSSTLVGAIDAKYSSDLLNKVELGVDNLVGGVNYNKVYYPCPLKKSATGTFALNTKNPYTSEREVKIGNTWTTLGSKSNIIHRSFADNPHAGTGLRPNLIMLEEVGLFHNLIETLGALRDTYTKDLRQFGVVWMFGTGGAMSSGASMAVQEVFENPESFYCLSFKDIYEGRKNKIGYFVPKHMTLNEFKDEEGNTILELAKSRVERDRQRKAKGKNKTISSLDRQNNPEKPSEAFEVPDAAYFPTLELKDHLIEVKNNPDKFLDINYVGKFKYNSIEDTYEFETVQDLLPIRSFPLKEKVEGACEMFEPPARDARGEITSFRYIAGIDPYDKDASTTDSLGSFFILDRYTDRIVFEYTGRPERSNIFYEVCRRALLFYNAIAMYESNLTGLYSYFEKKNSIHLLADTPENMRDNSTWKEGTNTSKGIPGTEANNKRGREFLDNWLRDSLMDGSDRVKLHTIRSVGLLEELTKWNNKGNFDRVSAMGILMWYRQTFPEFNYNEDYENTKKSSKFGDQFSRFKSKTQDTTLQDRLMAEVFKNLS
jgi:hypothetical protein